MVTEKKCRHSLFTEYIIEIYWVRDEFYIITETYIPEIGTDKRILTFPIQVFQFSIAFLERAKIL